MRFASLHHHSTYSFLDGFQLPDAHVRRISELNGSALALTEHGNVMSHAKFEQAASKEGIKPIFGIELYCGEIDEERRTQKKNHLTILAKNAEGYRNVLKLVSDSWKEGFYYKPTVSGSMLREASAGLVVLSGCQSSLLTSALLGPKIKRDPRTTYGIAASQRQHDGRNVGRDRYRRARAIAARFKRSFGDDYFIEVQAFPGLEDTRAANPALAQIARELDIPLIATLDCHYTLPTEREIQQTLHAIRNGGRDSVEDISETWGYAAELCPPLSDRHILKLLIETGIPRDQAIKAVSQTWELADDLNVELPRLKTLRYPLPPGYETATDLFRDWLRKGWAERGVESLSREERKRYAARLRYEVSIIEEKDFCDYFLVVSDGVRFAKHADIGVGPARGSAAASLVCWLLFITEVNPMLFPHLVFERFIDLTREDLPDIDLDFESARRSEVGDFFVSKFGRDCVSQIGTYTKYKSRLALDDVARVHRVPDFETDKIKDVLLERSSGDLRASATIIDTIDQFDQARDVIERHPELMVATELEGNVKGFGVHAAGIAISNEPITNVTAILQREVGRDKRPVQVVAMDKYDAEYLGVLKIDFLGLSALDALVEMCRSIDEKPKFLYTIPTEDDETIKGFQENDIVGVFQYEGRATRMVNGSVKPDNFDEVCHIIAISRPGPLHNGAVADYVDIKRGDKQPTLRYPALEAITKQTMYQVVYQEQILRIVREIGDFDWTHASYIRKIISRKLGDAEFNRQWDRFWEGAQRLHPDMDEETARAIWGLCTTAGSYAFNFAHTVSYGYISWWTMWFKRHYPAIFYAAMLHRADKKTASGGGAGGSANAKATVTSKAKLDGQTIMIRDALNSSGQFSRDPMVILPYDLRRSSTTWKREGVNGLRPGFDQIDGIGEKMADKIIEWRKEVDKSELGWKGVGWSSLIDVKGIGQKTIEKIVDHATDSDPFKIKRLDNMIESVKRDLPNMRDGKDRPLPFPTHTAIDVPYERGEDQEIIWIGVAVHKNLRDIFEVNRARTGEELDASEVKDPHLNEWMLVAGYDGTDLLSLRINRWRYPDLKSILWKISMNEDILLVRGVKPGWRAAREIRVQDIWVIDPDA
jgi:DNA polymerase-3 subunit alpha